MRGAYFAQGRYVLRLASMLFPERALELSHSVVNKTKAICCLFLFICSALVALAAPASTPRLGIVVEDAAFNAVSDVLTVELSGKPGVQLVERAEIDKVYREQKLSAASRDYLKLGQVLGADGLLILQRQNEDTNQFIAIRHIAVKPGVILSANRFAWPMTNVTEWASFYAKQIEPQFPKLGVSARDAVPLSIVHIRSAIASAEVKDTEAQLKLLLIERLSREPQFFVLERQRLQLLGEEKDLQADDSAFWSGAWLVDGTVDQAGYSKDRITIDARLTPPKGSGSPVHFQIAGSRTNLPEVINRVALKIGESLKVAVASEWRPEDEAEQYLANAKWALRWGLYREAQAAADSAWALGRKDVDCATARLKAYLGEFNRALPRQLVYSELLSTNLANPQYIGSAVRRVMSAYPLRGTYAVGRSSSRGLIELCFAFPAALPNPALIARAKQALELYYNLARSIPKATPSVRLSSTGYSRNEWDDLGVETLISASRVLQDYNLFVKSEDQPATELAELRELVRTVADFISATPAVHDSYFVGDRVATSDELSHTVEPRTTIFMCKVNWGCFWQERPEDAIALYSDLMSSPVFCYIHRAFLNRPFTMPRLVAWNERDKQRIPALWTGFMNSLNASTNILLQMEAKALERADALTDERAQQAEAAWWKIVRTNREALISCNVDLFRLGWNFVSPNSETDAMTREYRLKTLPALQTRSALETQKKYLARFTPYEFFDFRRVFQERSYTREQAQELLPLITAYKSNLFAQAPTAPQGKLSNAKSAAQSVEVFLERRVRQIIDSPAGLSGMGQILPRTNVNSPSLTSPGNAETEIITNVIMVRQFHAIPSARLPPRGKYGMVVRSHHLQEDKLVLDLQYNAYGVSIDPGAQPDRTFQSTITAIAIFDPASRKWEVINCPPSQGLPNQSYHRTVLAHGDLYTSDGGRIMKYESSSQRWQDLEIPNSGNCELFYAGNRLFASNPSMVFEITDGGKSSRVLASNRRQPPVSILDSENLRKVAVFEGPGRSLRLAISTKIFAPLGEDWCKLLEVPFADAPLDFAPEGVLFRSRDQLVFLPNFDTNTQLFLQPAPQLDSSRGDSTFWRRPRQAVPQPLWALPTGLTLQNAAFAVRSNSLYAFLDHTEIRNIVKGDLVVGRNYLPKDGYNAALLRFSTKEAVPKKYLLGFEAPGACPPVPGSIAGSTLMYMVGPPSWIAFSSQYLLFGLEKAFYNPVPGLVNIGCTQGIWLMPLSELDDAPPVHE